MYTTINNKTEQLGYITDKTNDTLFMKYQNTFTNNQTLSGYISKITGGTKEKPTLGCVINIFM